MKTVVKPPLDCYTRPLLQDCYTSRCIWGVKDEIKTVFESRLCTRNCESWIRLTSELIRIWFVNLSGVEKERVTSKTGASRITVELIRGATLSGVSLVEMEL